MPWVPPPESDRAQRTPLYRPRADEGVSAELEHHRAALRDRLVEEGMEPEAAAEEAARRLDVMTMARRLGPGAAHGEGRMGLSRRIDSVMGDLRMGVRELTRRPGYALSVLFALGVGVGGSALLLSLTQSIFLRPIPVPEPERLVRVYEAVNEEALDWDFSYPALRDYRDDLVSGIDLAGRVSLEVGISRGDRVMTADAAGVTWNYFRVLGLQPATGRFFGPDDEIPPMPDDPSSAGAPGSGSGDARLPGASPAVAVLGWNLWQDRFGGDPDLVGGVVRLGEETVTVIGIAPEGFRGISLEHDVQVWFPIPMLPRVTTGLMGNSNSLSSRRVSLVAGVARLPEGVSASQLVERLGALRHRYFDEMGPDLMPAVPEGVPLHTVRPAGEVALGDDQDRLRRFVVVVSALAVFVLLVGTLNALQLRMVRLRGRESEMGVRRAIGASRGRMVGQLAADGMVLAVGGVVLGILFSRAVLALLSRFTLPGGVALERLPLTLDGQLVTMISGVAVLSVLVAGLIPAWKGSRVDPARQLRTLGSGWGRTLLVGGQVALSTVLVVTAALFLKSFVGGLGTDLGFETDQRVAVTFAPSAHTRIPATELATRIVETARRTPGVEAAAVASHVPASEWGRSFTLYPLGGPVDETTEALPVSVTLGPVATLMGIPLLDGRDVEVTDDPEVQTAVVNLAAAQALFPGLDPVGRHFKLFDFMPDSVRIVGLVENAILSGVEDRESPWVWLDAHDHSGIDFNRSAHLIVKGPGGESELLGRLLPRLANDLPEVLFVDPRPVEREVVRMLMPQHLGLLLFGIFGGIAVLLSALGVAGVVGFELTSRRREIGIRTALGAGWVDAIRPMVVGTLGAVAGGILVGVVITAGVGRLLESFLIQTDVLDPVAVGAATGLLVTAVLIAAGVTLYRNGSVRPARILAEAAEGGRI